MFNSASHPYMQEDHVASLNMVIGTNTKLALLISKLYRRANNLLRGTPDPEDLHFISRLNEENGNKTAIMIDSATGQFIQLAVRPAESSAPQLSFGKFTVMTVVDRIRNSVQLKLWN